ncbi:baseplate wedge tail fiber connector [Kosakonia phage 305]|uniref:Baseplate wedge tail fiber connector n=1 Tax=Kosakonia phage 305 TaxID=2863193 RepID=A0AAE8BEM8_9CAUD|nr:baseplate wedge tail fiber protein connector [Kosakonia phage 305]QYN80330.1 baseplate wedge tail fiber connector [Kosakonia phage 305]
MIPQVNGKLLIDVGEIGNASTGDILYDGGVKLNTDLNNIYNTFGDQRLADVYDSQKLHATGYYQKVTKTSDFGPGVDPGTQADVDTSAGNIICAVRNGKVGEGVVFINSTGSFSTENFFEIQVVDSFVSIPSGNLRVTTPFSRITVWCVSVEGGVVKWDYSIESMFGDKSIPLNKTFQLSNVKRDIQLFPKGLYQTAKILATASTTDGTKYKVSEILLYVDSVANKVYSTEYAVIRGGATDDEDELYDLTFSSPVGDYIIATVNSPSPTMRLALKIVETQSFGVTI